MGDRKNDMGRIGLFQEMGYVSIGDKYKSKAGKNFVEGAGKGKQMLPGGSKKRSALQNGYFDGKFTRIMENEAYTDPIKLRRQHRLNEAKKNIGKAFMPSNGDKLRSGLGSHYGTFGGPMSSMSPGTAPVLKSEKGSLKNFLTNPSKKGTGFGYVKVTIGSYHTHSSNQYDAYRDVDRKESESHKSACKGGAFRLNMHPTQFFDNNPYHGEGLAAEKKSFKDKRPDLKPFKPSSPGKNPAGSKLGTFDPYPSHSTDPYAVSKLPSRPVNVVNNSGKIFMPSAGPKSTPQESIMDKGVLRSLNSQNYRQATSTF